jgi:hypothetical protein
MTVSASQIQKAKQQGLVNVEAIAAACDKLKFPFYMACTIMERETRGKNIYGHDVGGIFTQHGNLEVTETNYKTFLRRLLNGERSNGVGPMQLTYKGYHIGPQSLTTRGYKAWIPVDNILYGAGIMSRSYRTNLAKGQSVSRAFWNAAKSYNGAASYANGAAARARTWLALVGISDTRNHTWVAPVPPGVKPEIKQVTAEVLEAVAKQDFHILTVYGAGPKPDHNNLRCVDYMISSAGLGKPAGDAIAAYLIANADRLRVNWFIWNHRIWRRVANSKGPAGWSKYTATSNPHTDHVHLECAAGVYRPPNTPPPPPPPPPPPEPEHDVTIAELKAFLASAEGKKLIAEAVWDTDDVLPAPTAASDAGTNKFQKGKNILSRIVNKTDTLK